MPTRVLTTALLSRLAARALHGIRQEYPNSPAHVIVAPDDLRAPRVLHPAFYGCFDWHSAVHSHWLLLVLLRQHPQLPEAAAIRAALDAHLSAENLQAEAAYFAEPGRATFERPYGWAWLLRLAQELRTWDDPQAQDWSRALQPLADTIVARYLSFLPRQTYPVRSGVHSNTAFALACALDYARATGHAPLQDLVERRARDYYGSDRDGPARWEPSGSDFFSPCLVEADLMRRVLPAPAFGDWLAGFLPELHAGGPASLLAPAQVSDRSDGHLVHLDGLNLSRAWCFWNIAGALDAGDPRRALLAKAAERHAEAGLAGLASEDYMGTHWLGSFAVLMLLAAPDTSGEPAPDHTR